MPSVQDQVNELNKIEEKERLEDRNHLYRSVSIALSALKPQSNPKPIDIDHLNREVLINLVNNTHDCLIHYSGNCGILSGALLFNLKAGQLLLRVSNSELLIRGLHRYAVNKLLFSGPGNFHTLETVTGTRQLENKLLDLYRETNERFFRINNNHHQWNAVILLEKGEPVVQFVDAWKTSNPVPSSSEFSENYAPNEIFDIELIHGRIHVPTVIKKIQSKGEVTDNFDLNTFKTCYLALSRRNLFSFFKQPFNSAEAKVEQFKTKDDVLTYAKQKPDSTTAEVLKVIGAISS